MALSSDEFTFFNETESSQDDFPLSALECYCAAAIIIFFCISLSGNSFLMWVIRKEQAWKITPDILLLQLTISNLCITVTLPFEACNLLRSWIFGEWVCGFMTAVYYLGLYASILILTVMSLHYYFSFVQVSRLCAQVSRKCGVLITSILVWLVCAAASIKQFMYTEVIFEVQLCLFEWTQARVYTEFCLFFLIPFLITTFCHVHMWIMMKQGKINRQQLPSKVILGITFGTFLCLTPLHVCDSVMSFIIWGFVKHAHAVMEALHLSWFILYPLSQFCCCLSPLFHIIGAQSFRRYLPMLRNPLSQSRDVSNDGSSVAFISLKNTEEIWICDA